MYEVELIANDVIQLALLQQTTYGFHQVFHLWGDDVLKVVKSGEIDPDNLTESVVNYAKKIGAI